MNGGRRNLCIDGRPHHYQERRESMHFVETLEDLILWQSLPRSMRQGRTVTRCCKCGKLAPPHITRHQEARA